MAQQATLTSTSATRTTPTDPRDPALRTWPEARASANTRMAVVTRQERSRGRWGARVDFIIGSASSDPAEGVDHREGSRPADDQEQARQDEEHQGDHDLDGHLLRLLFGPLPPLDSHLLALDPQHPADRDAEVVGLHHRQAEGPQVIHRRP